ncbi:uncharacterized protein LOC9646719 isoform X2 [Selaginella moellendorffii]|uniref:uncharacterized protein LOC9646719 isoform X2 n=1 Tax=Selaginella moellendorffii TaxID=88036 RepID=UPI000D1C38F7|nr:uncharacterized protein LOC9646719 isoform X2 [Selaginella moellendorffii]|eukprot:XP_024530566.1 uncharacterized protein LOC9646719 isoform X2 [Selaginella moellendorffii]
MGDERASTEDNSVVRLLLHPPQLLEDVLEHILGPVHLESLQALGDDLDQVPGRVAGAHSQLYHLRDQREDWCQRRVHQLVVPVSQVLLVSAFLEEHHLVAVLKRSLEAQDALVGELEALGDEVVVGHELPDERDAGDVPLDIREAVEAESGEEVHPGAALLEPVGGGNVSPELQIFSYCVPNDIGRSGRRRRRWWCGRECGSRRRQRKN